MNISINSKMDLSFYDRLMEREYRLEQLEIEAGYLLNKVHVSSGLPMGYLAALHNFGSMSKNIPARPFILMGAIYWTENKQQFSKGYVDFVFKRKSPEKAFAPIGRLGVRSIQKAIMSQAFVPLAPRTIKDKGSSTILFDTGELINGATWKVGMK